MKKVAVITGGQGNLGKATVSKFVDRGFSVVATVSPGKKPDNNSADIYYHEVDLRDEKASASFVESIISQFTSIDALVCTVGGFEGGNIEHTDDAALDRMFALNFNTAFHSAKPVFMQMKKQGYGKIILIGSRPAVETARAKYVVSYALSKSLLINFADILNADAGTEKFRCHVVAPGTIDTAENRKAMPDANFDEWISVEALATVIFDACENKVTDTVIKAW